MLWHCKSASIDKQITQNYVILEKKLFWVDLEHTSIDLI